MTESNVLVGIRPDRDERNWFEDNDTNLSPVPGYKNKMVIHTYIQKREIAICLSLSLLLQQISSRVKISISL